MGRFSRQRLLLTGSFREYSKSRERGQAEDSPEAASHLVSPWRALLVNINNSVLLRPLSCPLRCGMETFTEQEPPTLT